MDRTNLIIASDVVRFVLISLAAVIVGATIRVIQHYYRAYRGAMKRGDFRGILPMHVWLIGSSYVLLVIGSVGHNVSHLGKSPTLYLAVNSAAFPLGVVALSLIHRFEQRRVKAGELEDRRIADQKRLADLTTTEFRVERFQEIQKKQRREQDISRESDGADTE